VLQYGRCDLISADGSRDRLDGARATRRRAMRDLTSTVRRDATRTRRERATTRDGKRRAATRRADGERERGDAAAAGFVARARSRRAPDAPDARGRGRRVTRRERVADAKGRRAAVERED